MSRAKKPRKNAGEEKRRKALFRKFWGDKPVDLVGALARMPKIDRKSDEPVIRPPINVLKQVIR